MAVTTVRQKDGSLLPDRTVVGPWEKDPGTVWDVADPGGCLGDSEKLQHPATFGDNLPIRAIRQWTDEDDLVLDPFAGSGTSLIAAKKLGRHFLGMDISPEYCAIARDRLARIDAQPNLFEPQPEQLKLGDL